MKQYKKKRTSDAIDNLLVRYLSESEYGLLILSSSTGSGKSYALQRLMVAKAFDDPRALGEYVNPEYAGKALERIKKIYDNTTLKDNLPDPKSSVKDEDEESKLRTLVRETAAEIGRSFASEDEFNRFMSEHFLFLDAKSTPVLENYSVLSCRNEISESTVMGDFIKNNKMVCDNLLTAIDQVQKVLENNSKDQNHIRLKQVSMDEFNKAQSAFCYRLKKYIKSKVRFQNEKPKGESDQREVFKNPEAFAKEIRWEDSRWHWIGVLYPAVYVGITPVIILSSSKMYRVIDPIIEPAFNIYSSPDHKYVSGSVMIYDEFDAVKEVLLDTMIEDATKDKQNLDLVPFFDTMEHRLQSWQGSRRSPLDRWVQDAPKILEKITDRCHGIWSDYFLDSDYKTEQENEGGAVGYVFYDALGNTQVVDGAGHNSHLMCIHDKKEKVNRILFQKNDPSDNNPDKQGERVIDLRNLIRETRSFIYEFASCVNQLADKYCEAKEKSASDFSEKNGAGEAVSFTSENAVKTILDEFRLGSEWTDYLSEYSMQLRSRSHYSGKTRAAQTEYNRKSLYTRGISLLELNDRADHDMRTKFNYHSFNTTPESLLLPLCRTCLVIGVSATAGLENIKNFDIEYLSEELGDNYHSASNIGAGYREEKYEKEFEDIEKTFRDSQVGYDEEAGDKQIIPQAVLLPRNQPLGEILGQKRGLAENIENSCNGEDYPLQRYVNLACCIRDFFTKDIDSFLAVCDKFPGTPSQEDKNPFSEEYFVKMWKKLKKLNCTGQKAHYYIIRASDFKEKWSECRKNLEKGDKCFILSTAKTLGNGQNLQYKIPGKFRNHGKDSTETEEARLYSTTGGEPDYNGEKDIDAIYIELPSHALEYLSNGSEAASYKQLYTYILYAEYAEQYGDISYLQKKDILQAGFSVLNHSAEGSIYNLIHLVDQIPKKYIYGRIVVQAIGRICRTTNKRKTPYIYLDPRLAGEVGINGRLILNKEAEIAIKALSGSKVSKSDQKLKWSHILNRMSNVCAANIDHIDSFQYMPWDKDRVKEWENTRERLLRFPQPSKEEFNAESTTSEDRAYLYKHYLDRGTDDSDRRTVYYKTTNDFHSVQLSFELTPEFSRTITAESTNLAAYAQNVTIQHYFKEHGYALAFCENAQYVMDPATAVREYMGALGEVAGLALFGNWVPYALEPIQDLKHFEFFDYKFKGLPIYVDFKNWNTSVLESLENFSREVPQKISSIGEENCRLVFIVNILAPAADRKMPEIIPTNNGRIILVPSLLDPGNPSRELDQVFRKINRKIQRIERGD